MQNIKQEMKEQAVKQMKALKLKSKLIEEFELNNKIYKSKKLIPLILELSDEEQQMVKEYENKWNVIVYHVINISSNVLNQYELLYVSKDKDVWEDDIEDIKKGFVISQTIIKENTTNATLEDIAGIIGIKSLEGGLIRVC